MTRQLLRTAALALCAAALGACSLLGGGKPAHLYRFGGPTSSEPAPAAPAGQVGVFRANGGFQREAAGDRILTITGGKAAYIAQTRWVAPAATLWDQAVTAAFDADPGPVRLVSRGEPSSADYVLRLDVRNFETHYDAGAKAAPTVLVRVRAAMIRDDGRSLVGEQIFEQRVRAGDNRVGAIVSAYDQAVAEVLKEVVAWTNAQAQPRA